MTDSTAFISSLVNSVPELELLMADHVAAFDELLPHVFMGDVSRFVLTKWHAKAHGSDDAAAVLKAVFTRLEIASSSNSDQVDELIGVSFVENLLPDANGLECLQTFVSPEMHERYREMFAAYGA
jgi:hypothetical protein